jgi:hypothetical protein
MCNLQICKSRGCKGKGTSLLPKKPGPLTAKVHQDKFSVLHGVELVSRSFSPKVPRINIKLVSILNKHLPNLDST